MIGFLVHVSCNALYMPHLGVHRLDHVTVSGRARPSKPPHAAGHASPSPVGSHEVGNVFDPLLLDKLGVFDREASTLFAPTCGCQATVSCGAFRAINLRRAGGSVVNPLNQHLYLI